MFVDRIELNQFRAYERMVLDVPSQGLRIVGRNAGGKTSLLEALVLLSTTRSPRTQSDRDLVGWQSGAELGVNAYTRVQASVQSAGRHDVVAIGIELEADRSATTRKTFEINGDRKRAHDLVGILKCVLFSPEDVALVTGPPPGRRREIDILISQTDRTYLRSLTDFGKVLAQRNQLLRQFSRERRSPRDAGAITELSFWDDQMVASGSVVVAYRQAFASGIGESVRARARSLVDGAELDFTYQPRVEIPGSRTFEDITSTTALVAAVFERQLRSVRDLEFRRGMSLVGPHRDDYTFTVSNRDLAAFGSRGQQRLGVIAFKFASIEMITERTGELPILLLDDVLSELDATHRQLLLGELANRSCQILVTSTDADSLDHPSMLTLPLVEVVNGRIEAKAS